MTVRPSTKHNIQRDDENTNKPGFAVVQKILVTGSISMQYTGVDPGTGDILLSVTGMESGGDYIPITGGTATGNITIYGRELEAQAFIHNDSGISYREQNSDGSFVWLKGGIGSGEISGYLRSQLQASISTTELITNGTFESGTFVGWTQAGSPTITALDPFRGNYSAQCTASGTIAQTITVVANSYYLLEFAVKMDNDSDFHGIVEITGGDQNSYDAGNQFGGKWIRGATLIKALSTSMTLKFKAAAGTNFVYFDNITLKLVGTFSLEGMDSSGRWNIVSSSSTPLLVGGKFPITEIQSNGVSQGSIQTLDFISPPVDISVSGTVARIFITGSSTNPADTFIPTTIDGFQLQWINSSSIFITAGSCYAGNGDYIYSPTGVTLNPTTIAGRWYNVYAYISGTTAAFEVTLINVSPWKGTAFLKSGDTSRRFIGTILTNPSNQIRNFAYHALSNFVAWSGEEDLDASPFRALSAGTAATATAVGLTGAIPPMVSRFGFLRISNNGDRNVFFGPGTGTQGLALNVGNVAVQNAIASFPISSGVQIYYRNATTPTAGGAFIDIYGYLYDR